jgi:polysaccharide deacetylase 2 family uncharacterized protein YibQ
MEMTRTARTARTVRQKGGGKKVKTNYTRVAICLVILLALGVFAVRYFSAPPMEKKAAKPTATSADTLPKNKDVTGDADYRQRAALVREAIDHLLVAQKVSVAHLAVQEKRAQRASGGHIVWSERASSVTLGASGSIEELKDLCEEAVYPKGGRVFNQEADTWQGKPAIRLDIAWSGELGGEPLNLIAERLYVLASVPPALPPAPPKKRGKLAIIVDDCGYDQDAVEKITALKQKLTFAIIPYRQFSKQALSRILSQHKEAILHLPMEPLDAAQMSENITIKVAMNSQEIAGITTRAIEELPGVIGVNNHQGSRATGDERVMRAVLSVVKGRGLFFVDSNTQPQTLAWKTADAMGVPYALNRAFLDGEADVGYITGRLRRAARAAMEEGSYVAICHARPHTAIALAETLDELEKEGVDFVFVTTLLK